MFTLKVSSHREFHELRRSDGSGRTSQQFELFAAGLLRGCGH